MKKLLLFLSIILAFSCARQMNSNTESTKTVITPIVGDDVEEHGCKASAGYTWSVLRNECVRIFEIGIRLDHYEQVDKAATTAAFVVFETNNGNKAELFLDTEKKPIILVRKNEGQPWVKDDWQLIPWKGYVLKKANEIKYTGK
ncbi:hypothetical protein [Flavobacterium sp. AED]|uniref:hypothetical protein n=1 Tax=Flavobacterium sp. AED TaxID=1423323 RepID=UPI00057D9299|nr:hypothetical protein [Flavobacterium sp. AED]KIA86318.1 hypothetical protein OA85_01190 [Flavobacterium sp. AED]